jgi:hypothetical protein
LCSIAQHILDKGFTLDKGVDVFIIVRMNNNREQHQREIERGIKIVITPELGKSPAWRRVKQAALLESRSVSALVADGIMAALEAAEDALHERATCN